MSFPCCGNLLRLFLIGRSFDTTDRKPKLHRDLHHFRASACEVLNSCPYPDGLLGRVSATGSEAGKVSSRASSSSSSSVGCRFGVGFLIASSLGFDTGFMASPRQRARSKQRSAKQRLAGRGGCSQCATGHPQHFGSGRRPSVTPSTA
jgi:hypothetical protein